MQTNNEITTKLDAHGEVDYSYYVDQAHTLRSEAVVTLAGQLIERIKKLLEREPTVHIHTASHA